MLAARHDSHRARVNPPLQEARLKDPRRIDVHRHMVPPFYAQWLRDHGLAAGGLPIPDWSSEASLALMDE